MPAERTSGLFFSSLDPQQTNSDASKSDANKPGLVERSDDRLDRLAAQEAYRLPPITDLERDFRHGGWARDRERVLVALRASGAAASRIDRFTLCGTDCVIEYSPQLQRHRIRASYCGDRFCVPCAVARVSKIRPVLMERCKGQRVRFVTLTRQHNEASLNDAIDDLYRSFAKLRESALWRKTVRGGAAVLEVTRGRKKENWHVHLHCLVIGSYIDQAKLSDAWRRASGGSFIVDVREVKDHERGIHYVSKYVGKGFDRSILLDPDALIECICALRGRRVLVTFGCWHGDGVEPEFSEANDWKRVGRIADIAHAARLNQPWAIAVCRSLRIWFGRASPVPGQRDSTLEDCNAPSPGAVHALPRDTAS